MTDSGFVTCGIEEIGRKIIDEFTSIDEALAMIVEALEEEIPNADAI